MSEETYKVCITCRNCHTDNTVEIPKGTTIAEANLKCKDCECNLVHRIDL